MDTNREVYQGRKIADHEIYETGLKVEPLTSKETIGIIIGTNVGAGVMSMAFAAQNSGYPPLAVCLVIALVCSIVTMLYTAEVCFRTKGNLQLSGLSKRYLGNFGGLLIFVAIAADCFGALVAYMSGSGDIMAAFFGNLGMSKEMGSIVFFIPAVVFLYLGLKALGAGQHLVSNCMLLLVLILVAATLLHKNTQVVELWHSQWKYMIPLFNLAIFVFGAQILVPELVRGNLSTPKKIPKLIIKGMLIVLVITAIIPASVIALVGLDQVTQVATISWGASLGSWAYYTANAFALLAMLTSYWGLGGCLFTNIFDFFKLGDETQKLKRIAVLLIVSVPPLIIAYTEFISFVNALYFAGTAGGVLMGIVPILLLRKSRKFGDIEPAFKCGWYAHHSVQSIIVIIFISSGIYAIASVFGYLPTGW